MAQNTIQSATRSSANTDVPMRGADEATKGSAGAPTLEPPAPGKTVTTQDETTAKEGRVVGTKAATELGTALQDDAPSKPIAGREPVKTGDGKDDAASKHVVNGGGTATPGQKPKCFEYAKLEPSDEDPTGIDLKMSEGRVPQDPEMLNLVRDIFAVEHVVRLLFEAKKYKAHRKQFFEGLVETAKVGLCGTNYDVKAGQLDLSLTKEEIADAFPLLRDDLWRSYFTIVVWFTLIFATLGGLAYYHLFVQQVFADHNKALLKAVPALPHIGLAAVLIPLGVPIGIFLEFVFRVGERTDYDGLLAINPGRWQPWTRTATTLITAYVFAFIVGINAFQIGIAGVLLNNFVSTQPWVSIAVGFVTGFTYPYVRDIVTQFKPERKDATSSNGNTNAAGGARK